MASTVPAKSQPLHNFPLPSLWSKNHPRPRRPSSKAARLCPIPNSGIPTTGANPTAHNLLPPPPPPIRIKPREEERGEDEREGGERGRELSEEEKVWNLRPRKESKKRSEGGGKNSMAEEKKGSDGDVKREKEKEKKKEKQKKERFSISLSRTEIEEDFFAMTGSKPSRRPRKRSKTVQKQLDDIFPGMWLASITPDSYKVDEAPEKP